jgi:hypothetical protein
MLYVSDLDGTLLNAGGRLSETSRSLLSGMLSEGLRFTVASARSVWSIGQMLQGLGLAFPVIEFNGAFISDVKTGGHIAVHALKEAVKHGVYLEIQAAGFLPFISTFDGAKDNLYHSSIGNEGMRWYYEDRTALRDPRLRPPRALEGILDEQVICFTVIDREERLKPLAERLDGLYGSLVKLHLFRHFYCEGWHWLTVHGARCPRLQGDGIENVVGHVWHIRRGPDRIRRRHQRYRDVRTGRALRSRGQRHRTGQTKGRFDHREQSGRQRGKIYLCGVVFQKCNLVLQCSSPPSHTSVKLDRQRVFRLPAPIYSAPSPTR